MLESYRLKTPKNLSEFANVIVVFKTLCGYMKYNNLLKNEEQCIMITELIKNINYKNLFDSKEFKKEIVSIINIHKKVIREAKI